MFINVAFALPLNRTFHYRTSNGFKPDESFIGRRVLAPFGKKTLVGYVIGTTSEAPTFAVKPIHTWIDSQPLLDESLLELAEWLSMTYLCSVGEALAAILPSQLQAPKRQKGEGGKEKGDTNLSSPFSPPLSVHLSSEQKNVLSRFQEAVEKKTYHPFLLRGITHSGKTELYLRTIDSALKQGRQALFLLPEIALTPPFIDRLVGRYSEEKIGVWHSGLSPGERYRTWERARRGEIQVLLGARSAVFAPFPQLGVIVLDEEHEPTYKQEDRPRYHARDVALWRAKRAGAVLIMGSATPSLESYWHAKKGTYALTELTSRVEMRQLPPVTLIDRKGKGEGRKAFSSRSSPFVVFSEPLKLAIEQRLARREQVILFVNRRGFTPFLRCSKCGWVARCERCSMTLAEHVGPKPSVHGAPSTVHLLQCHGCQRTYPPIIQCPTCKSMRLGHFGIGTQRVEEEVKHLFPFVKIARLDRDVGQYRRAYENAYRAFAARQLDVLVGTQVIAKGFDFPGVTLVGAIDADVSLHLPDFRAAERTFQLMTQVAGRTGRGELGGKVLVQTHHPEHYALQAAQEHNYVRFYEEEIKQREALNYPPFCRLVHLVIRARKQLAAQSSAEELAEQLQKLGPGVDLLGPGPAPHNRLRGQFRYQIVLKGTEQTLAPYVDFLRHRRLSKAYLTVDIDPTDLL